MNDIKPWQPIEITDSGLVVCPECKDRSEQGSANHDAIKSIGMCLTCDDKVKLDVEQGRKDDSSKLRYSLLPVGTVNQVVQVLEFGSKKYADNNWQKVPNARTRYYDAALRHIDAWFNGDLKDNETGLHHLAHAICCLMFLMWFDDEQ